MEHVDIVIVGAGVVGLAVAQELARKKRTVFVIEQHDSFGRETSSRNSEVIHAGMYYPSKTLKAALCVEGNTLLYNWCEKYHVQYRRIGKYIVACSTEERPYIEKLYKQGIANGVEGLRLISQSELRAQEPHIQGMHALYSPHTGILDTHKLMASYIAKGKEQGVEYLFNTEFVSAQKDTKGYRIQIKEADGRMEELTSSCVVNCAGLHADTVAFRAGMNIEDLGYCLHYCKGDYFRVHSSKGNLLKHLVYPVPDAVSLGVHFTQSLDGGVRIGPSAYYIPRGPIDYKVDESKKDAFLSAAQKLLPSLTQTDITPDTAGVRPKLQKEGEAVKDFIIREESGHGFPQFINLIGIESPGLTASLAISRFVAALIA